MPKLSIIIPAKNDIQNFKKTIKKLKFSNELEVIVVDGKSNDGLSEYIKDNYQEKIILVKQKSKGIYQGFNEGLKEAKGDYISYLCCGDIYSTNIAIELMKETDATVIAASCSFLDSGNEIQYTRSKIKKISPSNMSILHGSLLVKRNAYMKVNGFNENFQVSADVSAIHKILKFGSIYYSDKKIVIQIPYGVSSRLYLRKIYEHAKIFIENKLYIIALFYIPKRLFKDYIILKLWVMIKKWT